VYENRLSCLAARQCEVGLACAALMPGPNMRYFCGLTLFMSERPIVAFFCPDRRPVVLLPVLERGRAEAMSGGAADLFAYSDEDGYQGALRRVVGALALDGKRCAVEYLHMRALELRALEGAAPGAEFVSLEESLPGLRVIKDDSELAAMGEAIAITEAALYRLIAQPLIGLTERQIAGRLEQEMLQAGADTVAFVIVVAGPNSTDPHKEPSDRPVRAGEFLTIDCGLTKGGYLSDITRTFGLGEIDARLMRMYDTVLRANAAGKAAVRSGIAAQEVDRAARQVIRDAGYGDYFVHRTGHGLGLEVHEPPYIVEGNARLLEAGMVFTVEPGIYVPGVGGVRIEDDVVVTQDGVDCLTSFPRELMAVS
jgi:Xaa-Pro dipeptidase